MNDATVKDICQAWAEAGYGDECFWEHWAECPTEETLTPNMLLACIETQAAEIERLRGALERGLSVAKEIEKACRGLRDEAQPMTAKDATRLIIAALTGATP